MCIEFTCLPDILTPLREVQAKQTLHHFQESSEKY